MSDARELAGKTVLVTGASSGLGRHFALMLARKGARVAAAARRTSLLEDLAREADALGCTVVPVAMDVASVDAIKAGVAEVEASLGPIHILVNNAGIAVQAKALSTTEAEFDRVFSTNVRGAFFVAQVCGQRMIERGIAGRIVNIASVAGLVPMPQLGVYGMSKAAVVQMTRALAIEWARHGISVNAICPGYVATDLNAAFFGSEAGQKITAALPKRRIAQPHDLDGTLLLLASPEAGAVINGAIISVDDGYMHS